MARTQAADYEQRREAIVEEAARLFARKGFNGASVSELAEACGMSKSLLYHYFPSKEEVLYGVMASHVDQLESCAMEIAVLGLPAEEKLGRLLHDFMDIYVGAVERQRVLLNELDFLPADKRAAIIGKQRNVIDAVQALLCQIHPELAKDRSRARARTMLVLGMINWTHTWFHPSGSLKPGDIAEMALESALA